jgi:hypothetical protein
MNLFPRQFGRFSAVAAAVVALTLGTFSVAAASSQGKIGPCTASLSLNFKKNNQSITAMVPVVSICLVPRPSFCKGSATEFRNHGDNGRVLSADSLGKLVGLRREYR